MRYSQEYFMAKHLSEYRREKLSDSIQVQLLLSRLTGIPVHELDLIVIEAGINQQPNPVKRKYRHLNSRVEIIKGVK